MKEMKDLNPFENKRDKKEELQNIFKRDIDLCAKSGLSNTGEKYILGNTIYV